MSIQFSAELLTCKTVGANAILMYNNEKLYAPDDEYNNERLYASDDEKKIV